MPVQDDVNVLVTIIDVNPTVWSQATESDPSVSFQPVLDQVLVFLNAFLALRPDNKLAVIGCHPEKSSFVYPTPETPPSSKPKKPDLTTEDLDIETSIDPTDPTSPKESTNIVSRKPANVYKQFHALNTKVIQNLKSLIGSTPSRSSNVLGLNKPFQRNAANTSSIAGALSLALCYINRIAKSVEGLKPVHARICFISVSPDSAVQYIPIMNSIFAALKSQIIIDVCKVYGEDTVFLQQAAHLTDGVYLRVNHPSAVLQTLLFAFLPDPSTRQLVKLPGREQVDFRAACFCHKKIIDIGYVCSVCLSIFCQHSPICTTCRTTFSLTKQSLKKDSDNDVIML